MTSTQPPEPLSPPTPSHETASKQPAPPDGRRFIAIVVSVLVVVAIGGALYVREQLMIDDPVVGVTEIAVRDNTFGPEAVEVPAGTTITWVWEGREPHNVVGDAFESVVQTEGTFAQSFTTVGSFDYECTLHTFMRGRVVVTD